jgi:hypothetical protein
MRKASIEQNLELTDVIFEIGKKPEQKKDPQMHLSTPFDAMLLKESNSFYVKALKQHTFEKKGTTKSGSQTRKHS